jgi:hypothetical protein
VWFVVVNNRVQEILKRLRIDILRRPNLQIDRLALIVHY